MNRSESDLSLVKVPVHLKEFVVEQDYERYTPIDHAVWRYVMRQNSSFLGTRAHHAYLDGLKQSGISIERIPNIKEMNECLAQIGWGAVTVNGFIPSVAFFDFQAHGILPIACDIRQYDHIAYTPAPDIIHEAAGHAPIIKDERYRSYLRLFGEIGSKALSTWEDYEVYEAIRHLSIVKEDPEATAEEIQAAEAELEQKLQAVTEISEATRLSRLYWWTVEYGLIGDLENPQIYGAGLLSSVGESMSCLQPHVKKIPFSLEACIETDFDITKPQPQLFVCKDFDQLIEAVQAIARTMAVSVGGTESLQKALRMRQISTSVFSSGLQVSGVLSELLYDGDGEAIYLKTSGPTALAVNSQELPGHGKEYHKEGFGSPIGLLAGEATPLELFDDTRLADYGIIPGETTTLTFASGITVTGNVAYVHREDGKVVLIGFTDCTVAWGDQTLFQPQWGTYDMAVGQKIVSVFAGAADRERFATGTHKPSRLVAKRPTYTDEQLVLHQYYQRVRDLREGDTPDDDIAQALPEIMSRMDERFPSDWLLRLEMLELLVARNLLTQEQTKLRQQLDDLADRQPENRQLIQNGLALLA
ncbi:aromatic amino acid hydroxylase [Brevibacillus sp. SYP-B805]|uniref:aromatic amino acid hydroxylase n=1 Tax=Brevibacillus sp. SYP-B805 TaxID=1578199 RepID=UPI0013EC049C|nr:aromatic amino acid hydroxylase [Brevibacillus sp. SYP-B805]NGQ96274.1 aromatic amino acid hydroxylase [Brevibacillus sp. SYP-B805]